MTCDQISKNKNSTNKFTAGDNYLWILPCFDNRNALNINRQFYRWLKEIQPLKGQRQKLKKRVQKQISPLDSFVAYAIKQRK